MIGYEYSYILIGVGFSIPWFIFFLARKQVRYDMITMSLLSGFLGVIANSIFIYDWWNPLTLDNTSIGVFDSFFVGFMIGGTASVLYEILSNKKRLKTKSNEVKTIPHTLFPLMTIISIGIFLGGFYIFNINSLITSSLALLIPAIFIFLRRPDLIMNAVYTGLLLVVMTFGVYSIIEIITPGWIEKFYLFQNTPKIIILNVPIDDIIHLFLFGIFIGPLFEYWKGIKLSR